MWRIRCCAAVNGLSISCQWLVNAGLTQLLVVDLRQPALHRRLAQLHLSADLAHAHPLSPDHLTDLQFEARIKKSSFRFRCFCCPSDLHLTPCTRKLDQDRLAFVLVRTLSFKFSHSTFEMRASFLLLDRKKLIYLR